MKKLYLGYFNYFATGEGFDLYIGTFNCEEREDPTWIFYDKVMKYNKDICDIERLKSSYEYYSSFIGTFLLKEYIYDLEEGEDFNCHVEKSLKELKEKTSDIFSKDILNKIEGLLKENSMLGDDFFLKLCFNRS